MLLAAEGLHEEAAGFLSRAVEELPGNVRLIDAESAHQKGKPLVIDIHALVFGVPLADTAQLEETEPTVEGLS